MSSQDDRQTAAKASEAAAAAPAKPPQGSPQAPPVAGAAMGPVRGLFASPRGKAEVVTEKKARTSTPEEEKKRKLDVGRVSVFILPADHPFVIHTLTLSLVAPNKGDSVEKKKKLNADVKVPTIPKAISALGCGLGGCKSALHRPGATLGHAGGSVTGCTGVPPTCGASLVPLGEPTIEEAGAHQVALLATIMTTPVLGRGRRLIPLQLNPTQRAQRRSLRQSKPPRSSRS